MSTRNVRSRAAAGGLDPGTGDGVLHRVAPFPVSSGISFRDLPASTLQELIKCCGHYETKAARYTQVPKSVAYEFSRDVQDIVRFLHLREGAQAERIRHLEGVLRQWESTFADPGEELQRIGIGREGGRNSPEFIARRLVELSTVPPDGAAAASRATAMVPVLEREMRSAQLALRDASRVARDQAAQDVMRTRREADAAVHAERAARLAAEEALQGADARAAADARRQVDEALAEAAEAHDAELLHSQEAAAAAAAAAAEDRAQLQAQVRRLQSDGSVLRGQLADLQALHAAETGRLQAEAVAAATAHAAERAAAAQALRDAAAAAAAALAEAEARYARSGSVVRARGMEAELRALRARQSELEAMVAAMQLALAQRQSAAAAGVSGGAAVAARGPGGGLKPWLKACGITPWVQHVAAPCAAAALGDACCRYGETGCTCKRQAAIISPRSGGAGRRGPAVTAPPLSLVCHLARPTPVATAFCMR